MDKTTAIEGTDAFDVLKQILSETPAEDPIAYGPLRRAPRYYAGTHFGRRRMLHADTERNTNGTVRGIRNKAARRIIRQAFDNKTSRVERGLRNVRAMLWQATEVVRDNPAVDPKTRAWVGKSTRAARRLLAKELAIHQPVYCPTQKELRAMRTEKRKLLRAGKKDFIGQAIERLAEREQIIEGGDRAAT